MNLPVSPPRCRRTPTWSRAPALVLLLACVAVNVLAPDPAQAAKAKTHKPKPQPEISAVELAQRIHLLINKERARHRLGALAWDAALADIAAGHSRDMARRNYFSHDTPEGRGFPDRYRRGGYRCEIRIGDVIYGGAENIALGRLYNSATIIDGVKYPQWNSMQQIARKTVDGWMHSAGHRHNILTSYWRHEGVGIEILRDNKVLITQDFC
jgi:uncharacterized protein YkwD